jgi:Putative auto-transporter adhesin, head GIN domain
LVQIKVMRISYVVILISTLSVSAFGQQSEVREIGPFQGLKASEAVDVYLKKGDKESIKVEVTGTTLSNVITELMGSTLKVHMRDQNLIGRRTVKVYVTYTRMEKISANSASNVFSEGVIKSDRLGISVSSAATVEISVESESVTIEASSAGNGVIEGKAKSLEIEASSAGDIDAYKLECEKIYARTSSAGSAKINVTKELEAHASSGGSIRYRGNPVKTNTDSSSGGSVKKTSSADSTK